MSDVIVTPVNTGAPRPVVTDTLAALKARISAAESSPAPIPANGTAPTDASPEQAQTIIPTPEAKAPEVDKVDGVQKFRDKDGQVSEDKLLKSNEHLEKAIAEKEKLLSMSREERQAHLLKQNKELNKKFTQMSQEVAKDRPTAPAQPFDGVVPDEISPETKRILLDRIEKGEVLEVMAQLAKGYGSLAAGQRMAKLDRFEAELAETNAAKQLDGLVEKGHTWIVTDGLGRFDSVFQEHPELRQLKDPYRAALGYMDDLPTNGTAPVPAQHRGTPILGGSSAVPPPRSAPLTSPEQEMDQLSANLKVMLQRGNRAEATKIQAQMDKLQRGY